MSQNNRGGPGWSPTRHNDKAPPGTTSATEDTPGYDTRRAELGSHPADDDPPPAAETPPVASILDEVRARAAARQVDGLTRADENTDAFWRATADQAIRARAETGRVFDAYALAEDGVPEPDHPSRWGPRFLAAARAGVIVPAGYASSRRPATAGSAVRVWRGARAAASASETAEALTTDGSSGRQDASLT